MLDTFRVQGLIDTDFMVFGLQHAIEAAWDAVKDLLNPSNPTEARHLTLQFLTVMISGQVHVLMVYCRFLLVQKKEINVGSVIYMV